MLPQPAPETTNPPPQRRLASLKTAAAIYCVNVMTMRRLIAEGEITGYKFGPRLIRVDLDELDAYLRPMPVVGGAAC